MQGAHRNRSHRGREENASERDDRRVVVASMIRPERSPPNIMASRALDLDLELQRSTFSADGPVYPLAIRFVHKFELS
ncbi:hypothetical protein NUW54_g11040 [Trametes sanguinea]|uniref:Uncharacterized protein n=1 Tax=Trametes sanguinea TaxID=158606 RepID=A0ACC1NMP3_9APHY|nr:hypothetical protein NUW54_g11040 [Trametes sanguinea]